MRVYLPAAFGDVELLAAGSALAARVFVPATDDEEGEFAAFGEAAQLSAVVISADVETSDAPLTIDNVASFHVDIDGSGDLAWFATQEIDAVLLALRGTTPG